MLSFALGAAENDQSLSRGWDLETDTGSSNSKRWHVSASAVASRQSGITVGIASEYSWLHGYARFGIHIGAKNNKLRDGFSWWSVGVSTEVPGHDQEVKRFYMDKFADNSSTLTASTSGFMANFGYALLRDVREPSELIFDRHKLKRDWHRIITWRRMLLHRAVDFYGTDTTQYMFLYAHAVQRSTVEASGRDLTAAEGLPSWGHIQSLMATADKPYEDQIIWRSVFESPIGQKSEDSAG